MAARRPFWKWRCWKSIGFCLWPPSTCIWNMKLKFLSKLDLCSGNHVVYRQTDRRTDGRTRWIQYTPPPTSLGGGIKIKKGAKWVLFGELYIKVLIYKNAHFQMQYLQKLDHVVNSLWPSVTIWLYRSGSTMAHIMTCCLTAPSHYTNQCWLIISGALWHSPESNFTKSAQDINKKHFKNKFVNLLLYLSEAK